MTPSRELRPLVRADGPELIALIDDNRSRLRAWLPWLDITRTEGDLSAFLQETHRFHVIGSALRFAIVDRGHIAGVVGLEQIERGHRHASIGYWLGRAHEGRGLMTRAVRTVCDYGFGELGLHRIEIRAAPENRRSRAIPERLGFTREGTLRENEWLYNHFVDHVVYSMLGPDWPAARKA